MGRIMRTSSSGIGIAPVYAVSFQSGIKGERDRDKHQVLRVLEYIEHGDPALERTCGLCDGADEDGRHGHDDAAEGGDVGEDLCAGGALAGEDALEVDLPGDAAEGEEQHVVGVVPLPARSQRPHPVLAVVRDRGHSLVGPGEGNAYHLVGEGQSRMKQRCYPKEGLQT